MGKKRNKTDEGLAAREQVMQIVREKEAQFKRAMNGDTDALMKCSFESGLCSKKALNDYYKIKEQYGD